MAIRFFFEYNKKVIQLPVNPETITVKVAGSNKTEEIVKLGEINLLKERRLISLDIKSFFPAESSGPYVLTKGKFKGPAYYRSFFEKVMKDKKPVRFVISDMKVNFLASVESFDWGYKAGDDDMQYTLKLKEYKEYSAKVVTIKTPKQSSTPKATSKTKARPKTDFAIGDTVIVNGKYWYTSYGEGPNGTFSNFTGKISHKVADKSRKYRYHITTMSGGWRGWVAESQMKHA